MNKRQRLSVVCDICGTDLVITSAEDHKGVIHITVRPCPVCLNHGLDVYDGDYDPMDVQHYDPSDGEPWGDK